MREVKVYLSCQPTETISFLLAELMYGCYDGIGYNIVDIRYAGEKFSPAFFEDINFENKAAIKAKAYRRKPAYENFSSEQITAMYAILDRHDYEAVENVVKDFKIKKHTRLSWIPDIYICIENELGKFFSELREIFSLPKLEINIQVITDKPFRSGEIADSVYIIYDSGKKYN